MEDTNDLYNLKLDWYIVFKKKATFNIEFMFLLTLLEHTSRKIRIQSLFTKESLFA